MTQHDTAATGTASDEAGSVVARAARAGATAASGPGFSPRLVLWHWLGARASLLTALAFGLRQPEGLVTSPFHPTALACAHLFVLGFLVPSVLGGFHASRRLALRMEPRGVALDIALLVATLVVASGVASHMLLGTYSGVAWSGGLLILALLLRVPAVCGDLLVADAPLSLRVGVAFSFVALLLTVCLGTALAVDLTDPFLPAGHQNGLVGHAHLGLFGFVFAMVASLGQRLLPMFVPAAPAPAPLAWGTVGFTAVGAYGFGAMRPFVDAAPQWPAFCLGLGALLFVADAVRMVSFRKPAPPDTPKLDSLALLLPMALLSLLAAVATGGRLVTDRAIEPGPALAYGVFLLLGFFGSLVLGVGSRLLPLCAWHEARRLAAPGAALPPPRRSGSPRLRRVVAVGWTLGTACLLVAIAAGSASLCLSALCALALATVADTIELLLGWRAGTRVT